jgi:hypothetical protein
MNMTESDLAYLKTRVDKLVSIETTTGEHLIAKVISVFDGEDNPDLFYELVSTSTPDSYIGNQNGGYSLPLGEIISVKAPQ